jgi:large subunit ribosomal protein L46
VTASLLLSRAPLLTRTPEAFETAYYASQQRLRHALSNPVPTQFYFKPGSLALRRFQETEHATEVKYYGAKLAGRAPEVGDVQHEPPFEETSRGHWVEADAQRGERSLDRQPEDEVFCLVEKAGKWAFPSTLLKDGESLDEAVSQRLTGVEGGLGGRTMDTWLVTRKPVGVIRQGDKRASTDQDLKSCSADISQNFFIRSHILAGEPKLSEESGYSTHAWLTAAEVEARLRKQGDDKVWDSVKGMFGVAEETEA